jgi:hypothetical protein
VAPQQLLLLLLVLVVYAVWLIPVAHQLLGSPLNTFWAGTLAERALQQQQQQQQHQQQQQQQRRHSETLRTAA